MIDTQLYCSTSTLYFVTTHSGSEMQIYAQALWFSDSDLISGHTDLHLVLHFSTNSGPEIDKDVVLHAQAQWICDSKITSGHTDLHSVFFYNTFNTSWPRDFSEFRFVCAGAVDLRF